MFYREASLWDNRRWPRSVPVAQRRGYDPALGRFAQADTIIPAGVQGLDRYAYANNSPLIYVDPTGHFSEDQISKFLKQKYGKNWESYLKAWKSDELFWEMLIAAQYEDELFAPESALGSGTFTEDGDTFGFDGESELYEYQGNGPYILEYKTPAGHNLRDISFSDYYKGDRRIPFSGILSASDKVIRQPLYDYSTGIPIYSGKDRTIFYNLQADPDILAGTGIPYLITGGIVRVIGGVLQKYAHPVTVAAYANNALLGQQKTIDVMTKML